MPDSEPVRPRASEALEAGMTASPASAGAVSKAMVKYGELVILGYNGQLPQGMHYSTLDFIFLCLKTNPDCFMTLKIAGDRGRRRSKFVLYRRPKSNGVVKSRNYKVNEAKNSQAVLNVQQHSISYTLSKNKAVIEEYTHDELTDLFQVQCDLLNHMQGIEQNYKVRKG